MCEIIKKIIWKISGRERLELHAEILRLRHGIMNRDIIIKGLNTKIEHYRAKRSG